MSGAGKPRTFDPVAAARVEAERARNQERARASVVTILTRLDSISGPGAAEERAELRRELDLVLRGAQGAGVGASGTGLRPTGLGILPGEQRKGEGILRGTLIPGAFQAIAGRNVAINKRRAQGSFLSQEQIDSRIQELFEGEASIPGIITARRKAAAVPQSTDLLSRRRPRGSRRGTQPGRITQASLGSDFVVGSGTALGIR